jgi:hypothetical protein
MIVDTPTTMNEYITASCFWLGYVLVTMYVFYLWFEAIGE